MSKKENLAIVLLLFITFIWGSTFIVVKDVITIIKPYSFNFIRFLLASIWIGSIIVIQIIKKKESNYVFTKQLLYNGIVLGIFLFLGFLLQTIGLQYTTSSKAGFITGLNVIFTPIILIIASNYRPKFLSLMGIIIAIIGLFLLTIKKTEIMNIGDIYILFCAVAFSIHIILTNKSVKKFPPLLLTFIQLMTVSVLSLFCSFITEKPTYMLMSELWTNHTFITALIITSLFATALAYLIQTYAQRILSPTRVAMTFIMEPVFAAFVGVFIAGDEMVVSGYIGCLLILIGMIFVELPTKQPTTSDFS